MGNESKGVNNIKLFKYVGETGRSGYERNLEHTKDREKWKISSHMLKPIEEHHKGEDESKVEFRMKILKTHKSAFERQVFEGIRIQEERKKHHLLNSKSEFNRCALPRLEVRLGEKEKTELEKERIREEKRETELEKEIRRIGKKQKK